MTTLRSLETVPGGSTTPTMSSKLLPPSSSLSQKPVKSTTPIAPRIDVEPIYSALKAAVGRNWNLYRETVGLYLLGQLNQEELSRRIDPFICCDPSRTHLHNQLICAIHANAVRDPPEPGVAAFVSANDKPTAAAKPVSGDAAEQRLKVEIMHLPARERHRLKKIEEDPVDAFQQMMLEVHSSRQIRPPDLVPTSAGGYNTTTNWELEISKRFAQPLFSESNEFPDPETIQKRMIPIAYQEGLVGGAADGCSTFVNIAAEMFIKEQLTEIFKRTKSNGTNYIQTGKFKRRKEKEEELARRGEIKRDVFGLLPVEVEAESKRRPFGLEDLRFSMLLGNSYLSQNKILSAKVANMPYWEEEDRNMDDADVRPAMNGTPQKSNGVITNGVNGHHDEVMTDVNEWWNGAAESDRTQLDDMLDDILATAPRAAGSHAFAPARDGTCGMFSDGSDEPHKMPYCQEVEHNAAVAIADTVPEEVDEMAFGICLETDDSPMVFFVTDVIINVAPIECLIKRFKHESTTAIPDAVSGKVHDKSHVAYLRRADSVMATEFIVNAEPTKLTDPIPRVKIEDEFLAMAGNTEEKNLGQRTHQDGHSDEYGDEDGEDENEEEEQGDPRDEGFQGGSDAVEEKDGEEEKQDSGQDGGNDGDDSKDTPRDDGTSDHDSDADADGETDEEPQDSGESSAANASREYVKQLAALRKRLAVLEKQVVDLQGQMAIQKEQRTPGEGNDADGDHESIEEAEGSQPFTLSKEGSDADADADHETDEEETQPRAFPNIFNGLTPQLRPMGHPATPAVAPPEDDTENGNEENEESSDEADQDTGSEYEHDWDKEDSEDEDGDSYIAAGVAASGGRRRKRREDVDVT